MPLLWLWLVACGPDRGGPESRPAAQSQTLEQATAVLGSAPLCEASAIVDLPDGTFLVADNEVHDRLFHFDRNMSFIGEMPMPAHGRPRDIEALARSGNRILVVGSHSTRRDGSVSAKRHRLRWLRLVDGRLVAEEACETAPDVDCAAVANSETEGAERFCLAHRSASLDIEGAMVVDGRIWLGFRSPRAGGLAILARLAPGPLALRFDGFRFFDLGGRAIRALQHIQGNTYAIAGPEADEDSMHELVSLDLDASTHEALVSLPTASEGVLVVPTADEVLVVIDGEEGESGTCRSPAGWARRALPSTRTRETGNR